MAEHVSSSQALVLIAAFGRVIDWLAAIDRPLPMSYVELWGLWVAAVTYLCVCVKQKRFPRLGVWEDARWLL